MTPSAHPSSLWGTLFRKREPWYDEISRMWAETPFFRDVPRKEIRKLTKNMHPRKYEIGEYIFHQGDKGAGAAMIKSGRVEIRYQNTILALLQPGDFFGEIALVLDELRTADAVAVEKCELVFFLRPDFEEWLTRSPQYGARVSNNLAHVLAKRLLHANKMLADERSKHVV